MELFNNPVNTFVAGFLGSPPMNQFKGTLTEGGAKIGAHELRIPGANPAQAGRDVVVGIRPEHMLLAAGPDTSSLPISLDLVEPLGSEALLHGAFGEAQIVLKVETNGDVSNLSGVSEVHVPAHLLHIFDAETGHAIRALAEG